eukprot:jgi/Mesvir1/4280/Mv22238-RA.1
MRAFLLRCKAVERAQLSIMLTEPGCGSLGDVHHTTGQRDSELDHPPSGPASVRRTVLDVPPNFVYGSSHISAGRVSRYNYVYRPRGGHICRFIIAQALSSVGNECATWLSLVTFASFWNRCGFCVRLVTAASLGMPHYSVGYGLRVVHARADCYGSSLSIAALLIASWRFLEILRMPCLMCLSRHSLAPARLSRSVGKSVLRSKSGRPHSTVLSSLQGGSDKNFQAWGSVPLPQQVLSVLTGEEPAPEASWSTFVSSVSGSWAGVGATFSPLTGAIEPLALTNDGQPVYDARYTCDETRTMWQPPAQPGKSAPSPDGPPGDMPEAAMADTLRPEAPGYDGTCLRRMVRRVLLPAPAPPPKKKKKKNGGAQAGVSEAGGREGGGKPPSEGVAGDGSQLEQEEEVVAEEQLLCADGLVYFEDGSYSLGPVSLLTPEEVDAMAQEYEGEEDGGEEEEEDREYEEEEEEEEELDRIRDRLGAIYNQEVGDVNGYGGEVLREGGHAGNAEWVEEEASWDGDEEDALEYVVDEEEEGGELPPPRTMVVEQCLVQGGHVRLRMQHTILSSGGNLQVLRLAVFHEVWQGPAGYATPRVMSSNLSERGSGDCGQRWSQRARLSPSELVGKWKDFRMTCVRLPSGARFVTSDEVMVERTDNLQGEPANGRYSPEAGDDVFDDEDGGEVSSTQLWLPGGVSSTIEVGESVGNGLSISLGWLIENGKRMVLTRKYDADGVLVSVSHGTEILGGWVGGRM